jgi:AcrR family transcriptional regulator
MRELTRRQREILDELGPVFDSGFADLNMATLASRLNCSLRTLYALAPSRDDLVLAVVDRRIRRIGRIARDAITEDMTALDAVTVYLQSASRALSGTSALFLRDIASVPTVGGLIKEHTDYVFRATLALLDLAVEQGDACPFDTAAIAIVLAGLGWEFTRPDVRRLVRSSPEEASDLVIDVIVNGLRSTKMTKRRDGGPH